jgi:F-type H+-transporting ATPase subunit a
MKSKYKVLLAIVVTVALIAIGSTFLRFQLPPVVISAEPLPGIELAGFKMTNTLLTALIVDVLLVGLAVLGTRRMKLEPTGLQNFLEWLVELLYNMTESIAGSKWAPRFFLVVATIFFYVLVSNWFGLVPGLAAVGFCEAHGAHSVEAVVAQETEGGEAAHMEAAEAAHSPLLGCHEGEAIIPLFRSPSTDLSNNLALALVAVFMTQVFGVWAVGFGYFRKFVNVGGMLAAFRRTETGERRGCAGMIGAFLFGFIEFFVGILETISEFAKVISFSFRLFGNIFAGEVMLLVLASLVPLVLTLPFLGLEIFVGLIQAFIFYILTLAFFAMATVAHGHQEEGH